MEEETLVDPYAIADTFEMLYSRSELQNPRSAIYCMVISDMPDVYIMEADVKMEEHTKGILREYWITGVRNLTDWVLVAGVAPYVWEDVPGTKLIYPRPMMHTEGLIQSFHPRKSSSALEYRWLSNRGKQVRKVHFYVTDLAPLSNGVLRTPLYGLLPHYRLVRMVELAAYSAVPDAANPYWLFEQHEKEVDSEKMSMVMGNYGEEIASAVIRENQRLGAIRPRLNRMQFLQTLDTTRTMNAGRTPYSATFTSQPAEVLAQKGAKYRDRAVVVDPVFRYKSAQKPTLLLNPADVSKRLAQEAASVFGLPLDFMQASSRQASANVAGMSRFVNDRFRDNSKRVIALWTHLYKHSWGILAEVAHRSGNLETAVGKKRKRPQHDPNQAPPGRHRPYTLRHQFEIDQALTIEVTLRVTPILSYERIRRMRLDNVLTHERFVELALSLGGLMPSDAPSDGDGLLPEERYARTVNIDLPPKKRKLEENADAADNEEINRASQRGGT